MNNTALVILAAGASSRFGGIKQLALINNKTLLQHAIDEALASGARPVIVVTGANGNQITKTLSTDQIEVYNTQWEQGIASSIVAGLQKALDLNAALDKVIMTVCDQPFVGAPLFKQLYETQQSTGTGIAAVAYAGTVGTPVLFTKKYFEGLLKLQGDEGAKKILRSNLYDVATVEFPEGAIDIDTADDYANLIRKPGASPSHLPPQENNI